MLVARVTRRLACTFAVFVATSISSAQALKPEGTYDNKPVAALEGIGIDQKLDTQLPMDLILRDEDGNPIRLGDMIHDRPVVLSLVYYECPMLCTVVLNNMLRSFVAMPTMTIGKEYDVVTVSFNPDETAKLASEKKRSYVRRYAAGERAISQESAERHWRFLTADAAAIKTLTDAVGFRYKYDPESKQYLHPSGVTIVTPSGKIARYFFGIDYEPTDLRLSLVEASQGKIGSITDHIMLYCFHYDAATGKYGFAVRRALRIGGAITVIGLALSMWYMSRRPRNSVDASGGAQA